MSINDGGPAFPAKRPEKVQKLIGTRAGPLKNEDIFQEVTELVAFPGMSLRDWFAGQALDGTIKAAWDAGYMIESNAKEIAALAYSLADAMLAARNSTQPKEA